jgi:hypothetical protein
LKTYDANPKSLDWFRNLKARKAGPIGFGTTHRSRFFDVEYHAYLRALRPLFRKFGSRLVW